MAYAKKTKETEWKQVKGLDGFSVIGTRDRFSISVELDENLRIGLNGCRVIDGKNGAFISYPAWKDKEGNYHDYSYITLTADQADKVIAALD